MVTGQKRHGGTGTSAVACSLAAADRGAQIDSWKQLARRAMTQRAQTARGLRVSFRTGPGIEDSLRQLAAVESECCSWATWAVERHDEEVVLDVSSTTEEGIATLHSMLATF
jgi:hypothetical protein